MTLRTKLSLSVCSAVAILIFLSLFLTWQSISQFIINSEEKHFDTRARSVENAVQSSFQEYLAARVRVVVATKQQMKYITIDARNDFLALEKGMPATDLRNRIKNILIKNHADEKSDVNSEYIKLSLKTIGELKEFGLPDMALDAQTLDVKKQSLADILDTLPADGEFSIWPTTPTRKERLLLFFLPVDTNLDNTGLMMDSNRVFVAGLRLISIFNEAETIRRNRLEALRQNFDSTPFYDNGILMIRDSAGNTLIKRGSADMELNKYLTPLYAKVKKGTNAVDRLKTENDEYLCHIAWIQPYRWYFVMAAPISILSAPSAILISKLLLVGLAILIFALVCTIFMIMNALRPLKLLRDCTSELAALDPTSSSSLATMERMLPMRLDLDRHDELGDLARSFASMSLELSKNIRASMAAIIVQKRMEGELNAARDIQIGILPDLNNTTPVKGFAVAAFLEPAREVGGDLYDCFTLKDGRKALVIGDVSGKGVPASLFMTMSVTLIRYAMRSGLDPAQALTRVNELLEEHNSGNMFVTLFLAIYSPNTGELIYANGGHCLPYIIGTDKHLRQLESLSGPLVGAMPDVQYQGFSDIIKPGESIFLYTDGLSEAMNSNKELYGDDRIAVCLMDHAAATPAELQKAVFADICAFRGEEPPSDDITMLTMSRYIDEESAR